MCVAERAERVEAVSQGIRTDSIDRELRENFVYFNKWGLDLLELTFFLESV